MIKVNSIICMLLIFTISFYPAFTLESGKNSGKDSNEKKVEFAFEEDEIPIFVRNEFDKEIQVQLDTGRKYPLGPKEKITLGKKKPGKYTLTIYNEKGEFVDNITKDISKSSKWILSNETVSNSDRITGLTTGQKVAIGAGIVGAAALGTALLNKANQDGQDTQAQAPLLPPPQPQVVLPPPSVGEVVAQATQTGAAESITATGANAFSPGGRVFKFLNTKYDEVTVIVEGSDGSPIGSNWVIGRGASLDQAKPLLFNGQKITINPTQKISVLTPEGYDLQRYAFELQVDSDGSYVWIVK